MTRYKFHALLSLVFFLAALILAACGPSSASSAEREKGNDPANYKSSEGSVAPDWALETLDGGTFRLAEHKGDVVVMFFMASWCVSCVLEARALAELHNRYAEQGLTVVAINVEPGKKVQELSRFRQLANNAAYQWAFDSEFAVATLYEAKALDTTIIIDRTGRIAYTDSFLTPLENLEAEIKKWL